MTIVTAPASDIPATAEHQSLGHSPRDAMEDLATGFDLDQDLVICAREPLEPLATWLNQLAPSQLPNGRLLIRAENARAGVVAMVDASAMPSGPMRDALVDDIEALVTGFAGLTKSERVDIRLDAISTDGCWRFHRDHVEARLLTTYRGRGTEWVPIACSDQAIDDQKDYRGPLNQMQPFDIALFRGSANRPGQGVVHRSPPIVGTGETRLLLCLNQPSLSSPPPWEGG